MQLLSVSVSKPEEINFILGQSHFIKTVEDLHEALITSMPGIQFGLAFSEASGPCLIRFSGTNEEMVELAKKNVASIACGHCFMIFLKDCFPISVLNRIKAVPEVCRIFCATANPCQVLVAETDTGRGILGVVDGHPPKGMEGPEDQRKRKDFLRMIGYKL